MCQNVNNRLNLIQEYLQSHDLQAVVIPSADPHQSEYLPDHWKLREWYSGFTGSAGTMVILQNSAHLWTDSRYFIQGEEELRGTGITLQRMGEKGVPTIKALLKEELRGTGITLQRMGEKGVLTTKDFLKEELDEKSTVSFNPRMWSQKQLEFYQSALNEANIKVSTYHTPGETIWNANKRPQLPKSEIYEHPIEFATRTVKEKHELVLKAMADTSCDLHLVTTLDDIAWLLNLRGADVAFNPVFLAHAIVGKDSIQLFVDDSRISSEIHQNLSRSNVELLSYDSIDDFLQSTYSPILISKEDCNAHLYSLIPSDLIVDGENLIRHIKACKTTAEISHIENAMIKDGLALADAFYKLKTTLDEGKKMSEAEFADLIARKRSEQAGYVGESFPAIIGYQANGAIVHYRPQHETAATIQQEGLLLCDSGGQYLDGTTDITRTIAVGPCTEEQKDSYTRVLKGHIAIDTAVFPEGTTGGMLDILARQYLWQNGQNFGHGTGHGVGYFLNVHEPPQGISPGVGSRSTTAFEVGMLTSNEPGYYEAGVYGIRIENLIVTEQSEHEGYLKHRHLTLFPIDTSVLSYNLLTKGEVDWINNYHELVAAQLLPHLSGDIKEWMIQACKPI